MSCHVMSSVLDEIKNEEVRKRTGQILLEKMIRERRMRWLGHVSTLENG